MLWGGAEEFFLGRVGAGRKIHGAGRGRVTGKLRAFSGWGKAGCASPLFLLKPPFTSDSQSEKKEICGITSKPISPDPSCAKVQLEVREREREGRMEGPPPE